MALPKNKHDVRIFLGLCTYWFANIAKPLTWLTQEGGKFQCSEDCLRAFDQLKGVLLNALILSYPLTTSKFIMKTFASNVWVASVLS